MQDVKEQKLIKEGSEKTKAIIELLFIPKETFDENKKIKMPK